MEEIITFGKSLEKLRSTENWSLRRLEKELKRHRYTISFEYLRKIEKNSATPPLELIEPLSKLFKLTKDQKDNLYFLRRKKECEELKIDTTTVQAFAAQCKDLGLQDVLYSVSATYSVFSSKGDEDK